MRWIGPVMAGLLLWSCAQMEPPPGGPQDQTAPAVEWHHPPAGSTGVSGQVELSVTFSEGMNRATVEEALFISPALDRPPRLKWRGRTLRIRPEDSLQAEQTYVITLGAGCKDLHNNNMENSYSFAFSTGQAIDEGQVAGTVVRSDRRDGDGFRPRGGVDLWAYRWSPEADPDPAVDTPDYITQADERGRYRLTHLGPDRYRIFAVEDRNRDRRWNAAEELFGLPSADADLTREPFSIELGPIALVMLDTLGPSLQSARAPHRSAVMLSFDKDLDSARAAVPEAYHIEMLDDHPDTVDVLRVSLPWNRSNEVLLSTSPQIEGAAYRVTVTGLIDPAGNLVRAGGRQAHFSGAGWADSSGPRLGLVWPPDSSDQVPLRASPSLFFDEAVEAASLESAFALADTSGQVVEGHFRFLHGAAAAFEPLEPLESDRWYVIDLEGSVIRDLSGHVTADTAVTVRFRTLDEERLGSVSGAVERRSYPPEAPAVILAFGPAGRAQTCRHQASGSEYILDRMLPGAYVMAAFLDLNRDGRWNPGRPAPFQFAEPLWLAADSVSVRSRWETAGVTITFRP